MPRRSKDAIDELFESAKRREREPKASKKRVVKSSKKKKKAPKPGKREIEPVFVDQASGLNVYSEEQLGLDSNEKGVFTPLCPFDCDCCF